MAFSTAQLASLRTSGSAPQLSGSAGTEHKKKNKTNVRTTNHICCKEFETQNSRPPTKRLRISYFMFTICVFFWLNCFAMPNQTKNETYRHTYSKTQNIQNQKKKLPQLPLPSSPLEVRLAVLLAATSKHILPAGSTDWEDASSTRDGRAPLSRTVWICSTVPAAMLLRVQQAWCGVKQAAGAKMIGPEGSSQGCRPDHRVCGCPLRGDP